MGELTVEAIGTHSKHPLEYTIDRPRGLGAYLILRFHCPVIAQTAVGRQTGETGDCLVYTPTCPQWYRGRETGLHDDWLHLRGSGVGRRLKHYGIPVNRIFRPGVSDFVTAGYAEIRREMQCQELFWADAVSRQVELLLLNMGRQAQQAASSQYTAAELAHAGALRQMRADVQQDLMRRWTIPEMARQANLSPNRFSVLYRKFFGCTPLEDLLRARVYHAQTLLTNTTLAVAEVARLSGFASIYYFSRVFRQRVGCAPTSYYKMRMGSVPPL